MQGRGAGMNGTLVLALERGPALASPGGPRPTLGHCLLLAALLHLWLVALIGTTPGGQAPPGEGLWGSIQIRLSGPGPADSPGHARAPLPATGPAGRTPEPRYGGSVRDAEPRPSPEPGAAQLGVWNARRTPAAAGRPAAPAGPPDGSATPAPPAPVLTRSEPLAPARRDEPAAVPATPTTQSEPRPAPAAQTAPSTAPRLAPVDTVEAPVLERPSVTRRDIAGPAVEPTPLPHPQPAPAPQREGPMVSAMPPPPPAAAPNAAAAADNAAPNAAPPVVPPVTTLQPPQTAPATVPQPPVTLPPAPEPAAATRPAEPVEALRAVEPPAPVPVAAEPEPLVRPPEPVAPPVRREPPQPAPLTPIDVAPLPSAPAPALTLPPVRAPLAPALPAPAPEPARGGSGQPDAGARVGPDRATAPSAAASAPRLNLELPAARAALPGLATPRLLNLVPPPPERKSALSEGIEKSARPDCRQAYSSMGALAAVPLALDALRGSGCRW